jgi:hypothetical protein
MAAMVSSSPVWEAFPELNRSMAQHLLVVLIERMRAPVASPTGQDGGEDDEHAGRAVVGTDREQGATLAS